ncbi:MAG TPA: MraY family glycosyltransferase [Thermoanaerobaculia bacterium]
MGGALLWVFVSAAVVAYGATFFVKRLAERIGCIDVPNDRSVHSVATPRLGGLSIIAGFAMPLMLLPLYSSAAEQVTKNLPYLFAVLAGGSCMIALGIYDDIFGSNAAKKFPVQVLAALLLIAFGFHFTIMTLPFIGRIELGGFGYVVSLLWIVGVINAVNFIDGMDGLATQVTLLIAAALGVIAAMQGDMLSLVILVPLAGSLIGFFPWNRPPARIFMGDTGSLFIGLLLAACSIARSSKSPTAVVLGGPILALALPVLDALLVMKGRLEEDQPSLALRFVRMINADRNHIHHILIEKYGSQRKATAWILTVTGLFGIAAIATVHPASRLFGYGLGAFTALLVILLRARSHRTGVPVASDSDYREAV